MKLYALHEFISDDLSFTKDQMILFRGLNRAGKVVGEYGMFDLGSGSIDTVMIQDMLKRGEISLEYVFDIFKNRVITLDYIEEVESLPRKYYPRCVLAKGLSPNQFSDVYDDIEEVDLKNIKIPDDPDDDYMEEESLEIDETDVF